MKFAAKILMIVAVSVLLLPSLAFAQRYTQTNLIADSAATADNKTDGVLIDRTLLNPWGLSRGSGTPWWINDNNAGISALYSVNNTPPLAATSVTGLPFVTIPTPAKGGMPPSAPSGVVFAGEANFQVGDGSTAFFIFVTEDGTISAFGPNPAMLEVDNSKKGAVYKGCTIAKVDGKFFLYVTNFRSGQIEVYNENFTQVKMSEEKFEVDFVPNGFGAFNIANIGNNLYVTYARQDKAKHDPVGGKGEGFVIVFSPKGKMVSRLEHGPWFDSPWGVTLAPRDFGAFSNAILVGNFGSDTDPAGEISAFDYIDGHFLGQVRDQDGSTLKIPNLWALEFGNSSSGASGPSNTLFFTAGPGGEKHGLFGTLNPVASEADDLEQ